MASTAGRTMLKLTAGTAVLLGSFWLTLEILDYWAAPEDPNADLIAVTEATYGMNCREARGRERSGKRREGRKCHGCHCRKLRRGEKNLFVYRRCEPHRRPGAGLRQGPVDRLAVRCAGDSPPDLCGRGSTRPANLAPVPMGVKLARGRRTKAK